MNTCSHCHRDQRPDCRFDPIMLYPTLLRVSSDGAQEPACPNYHRRLAAGCRHDWLQDRDEGFPDPAIYRAAALRDLPPNVQSLMPADGLPTPLVFWGDFGTGKSHAAMAFVREVRARGYIAVFASGTVILRKMKATFDHCTGMRVLDQDDYIKALAEVHLLVLDDWDKVRPTPWAEETLFDLVNTRYEAGLPTIFTTNANPMTLPLDAMLSRLLQSATVVEFQKSWRRARRGLVVVE